MKKLILIVCLFFPASFTQANPVIEPPILSEIYFSDGTLEIELFFDEFYIGIFGSLDNLNLTSSSDIVEFNDGIQIQYMTPMIITQSDLKSSFSFNPAGDIISIETDDGWEMSGNEFVYGNYQYSTILAPQPGQSLACYGVIDPYSGFLYAAEKAIEQPPTIGSNVFNINARGTLEGFVYDMYYDPVPWLNVYNVATTNQNGYFSDNDMFCRIYNNIWITHDGNMVYNFADTIFPGEVSTVIIHLDTLLTGIPEYSIQPNPFSSMTWFSYDISQQNLFSQGSLEIYELNGKLIEKINFYDHNGKIRFQSAGMKPGIYLYTLNLDGKLFKTKKMIKL